MYKKIILTLLISIFTITINYSETYSSQEPLIIPRVSWEANELYTSIDSTYWQSIIEQRKNYSGPTLAEELLKKRQEDYKKSLKYINENFSIQNTSVEKISYDSKNNVNLAWPIQYTNQVDGIVIHHTDSEYENTLEGIKDIYRYHSLNRQWGDIGYNYIIGYDGEIFEGRKGGDYAVAAHSKWNNHSTVGIAIIGNYSEKGINSEQYKSLEQLVKHLAKKYGIDFFKKRYYHMACAGEKCNTFPLETYLDSVLVGHRDTGHTDCPGDELQEQIQEIRKNNLAFTSGFSLIKREEYIQKEVNYQIPKIQKILLVLKNYSDSDLEILFNQINILLTDESLDHEKRKKLQILRLGIILSRND